MKKLLLIGLLSFMAYGQSCQAMMATAFKFASTHAKTVGGWCAQQAPGAVMTGGFIGLAEWLTSGKYNEHIAEQNKLVAKQNELLKPGFDHYAQKALKAKDNDEKHLLLKAWDTTKLVNSEVGQAIAILGALYGAYEFWNKLHPAPQVAAQPVQQRYVPTGPRQIQYANR